MSKTPKLVLVDGNALFHRAYHAIPYLTNAEGTPTNAVYGFTNILLKMMGDLKPEYVVIAWDHSGQTFRNELYPEYKATRVKAPDDLYAQIPIVKELVSVLGLPLIELENYEADDIIGTLAAQAKGVQTIIVTGDRDELQLVSDSTEVDLYNPSTGQSETYDVAKMIERYGLTPAQFIDLKALKGDASDNIPGVAGIGEKTAMSLISQYHSLDGVYTHIDEITGKLKERLVSDKETAYLSRQLSEIVCDAPVKLKLSEAEVGHYDKAALAEFFRKFGFKSLLTKLPQEAIGQIDLFNTEGPAKKIRSHLASVKYSSITSSDELRKLAKMLASAAVFAIDTETTSVDMVAASLVGISVSAKAEEAFYIPVGHDTGAQLPLDEVVKVLRPILENPVIGKIGHNIKFDYQILKRHGLSMSGIIFDTMVASFLINPLGRSQTLDDLAYSELGIEMIPITELIGEKGNAQKSFNTVPIDEATEYAAEDADMSWRLYQLMAPQLKATGLDSLAAQTEWPLIPILGDMELAGIELDSDFLKKFNKVISAQILKLEEEIWKIAGEHFNISSPAQLAQILFEKLGVSPMGIKKGKTGFSTAASELEKMRNLHPIVELIFQYRELVKLKNTYVDALPELVSPVDHRIHTSFNQTIAQTGRLSSTNPNLQNIPVRTELGREIRKAFVAPKSRIFVSADYSQIELRVAAALSHDEAMIETFRRGIDLHVQTAAELYNVSLEDVTKDMRSAAKTINFGVLYGMSAHGLSVATGMTREEASSFIARYFEVRPKLAAYIEDTKKFAHENEYTETLFGRRRPCPEINSNNYVVAQATERMAVNVPIQGTAADIYKLAMIALVPKLDDKTQLLLQIHDELISETDSNEADKVASVMKEVMENVYDLGVPLAVDTAIGHNWGEL
ncbi:MAG: DNA polymerase I [Candidatus Saccharimonadia bacterium]